MPPLQSPEGRRSNSEHQPVLKKSFMKLFASIKRNTPTFVQFNKLPASRLQGVVTRVEM
jgi:hypothetical protein